MHVRVTTMDCRSYIKLRQSIIVYVMFGALCLTERCALCRGRIAARARDQHYNR